MNLISQKKSSIQIHEPRQLKKFWFSDIRTLSVKKSVIFKCKNLISKKTMSCVKVYKPDINFFLLLTDIEIV